MIMIIIIVIIIMLWLSSASAGAAGCARGPRGGSKACCRSGAPEATAGTSQPGAVTPQVTQYSLYYTKIPLLYIFGYE